MDDNAYDSIIDDSGFWIEDWNRDLPMRVVLLMLLLAAGAWAATLRLYLKDGTYQIASEYKVLQDRVRFYSTERGEWEEIPLEMVDLKRTEAEINKRQEMERSEAKATAEEEKAEREARKEVQHVPMEFGAFWVDGDLLKPMKPAESKVVSNKRRTVLKVLSPIPVVTGKATLELDGTAAQLRVTQERPEFYIRLSAEERFGIIKLTPKKDARVVENLTIIPISKEVIEEQQQVETFRQQLGEGLYKIWPQKPLEPGEYAVVQYTEGKVNVQVWDFGYTPAPTPAKN